MPDKKGLWSTEELLKISGWVSEYCSVQKFLNHLRRKTKSESSRLLFCEIFAAFCRKVGYDPDSLVSLGKGEVKDLIHGYLDGRKSGGISRRLLLFSEYIINSSAKGE